MDKKNLWCYLFLPGAVVHESVQSPPMAQIMQLCHTANELQRYPKVLLTHRVVSEPSVCREQLWELHNSRQKAANKHSVPLSPSLFSLPHLCYIQIITLGFTSYLPTVNISYSHDYNSALSVHKHLQLLQPNHKHCGTVRRVLGEKQTVIWTNLWVSHAVALFIQWSWRSNM